MTTAAGVEMNGLQWYLTPVFDISIFVEDDPSLGKRFYNIDVPVENVILKSLQADLEWNRVSIHSR